MKTEMNEKYYLGDGIHYFTIFPDKINCSPLAKLYLSGQTEPLTMLTVGNKSHFDLINYFEIWVTKDLFSIKP